MKADRNSNRVLHCDNPSMESTLSAPDGARVHTPTPKALRVYLISSSIPDQVKKIFIRPYPPLSVAKEKKNSFNYRCTQIKTGIELRKNIKCYNFMINVSGEEIQ